MILHMTIYFLVLTINANTGSSMSFARWKAKVGLCLEKKANAYNVRSDHIRMKNCLWLFCSHTERRGKKLAPIERNQTWYHFSVGIPVNISKSLSWKPLVVLDLFIQKKSDNNNCATNVWKERRGVEGREFLRLFDQHSLPAKRAASSMVNLKKIK